MNYSKCFFSFVVGGCLLSSATVWAVRENDPKSLFVPYVPGKTETLVVNGTKFCVALFRPDGKNIKENKRFIEIGSLHTAFLPADHPAKLDVVYMKTMPLDAKEKCVNDVSNPNNKIKRGVHFNLTAVDIKDLDPS